MKKEIDTVCSECYRNATKNSKGKLSCKYHPKAKLIDITVTASVKATRLV